MKSRQAIPMGMLAWVAGAIVVGAAGAATDPPARSRSDEAAVVRPSGAKEGLGALLFNDTRLSEPAGQSCATCHDAGVAFTDPDRKAPTSKGVQRGRFGSRNTPSAMYMAFSPAFHFDAAEKAYVGGQFYDGRAATLEEQAKGPFLDALEMANTSKSQVVAKVANGPYAAQFEEVYGARAFDDPELAFERIADAIAAFERSAVFSPFSAKYDAFLAGQARLTPQEQRGLELFEREDKGNCAACHPSRPAADGTPPLFTDFTYDNLGVPKNPKNPFYGMGPAFNPQGRNFVDRGLGAFVGLPSEDGKFKVPTLRNIALTAPYMHNGYFDSLRAVVDFYTTRDTKRRCSSVLVTEQAALAANCWPRPEVAANVNREELGNLRLTPQEVDDIVAFMRTLTDGWRPADRR